MKTKITDWFKQTFIASRRRVQLARDVIAQLHTQQLKAQPNELWPHSVKQELYDADGKSAKAFFSNRSCSVCAKGALLISYVRRHNKLTCYEFARVGNYDFNSFEPICDIFPAKMLAEIEVLFERPTFYDSFDWNCKYLTKEEFEETLRFSLNVLPEDPTDRLKVIMGMIIDTNGSKVYLGKL